MRWTLDLLTTGISGVSLSGLGLVNVHRTERLASRLILTGRRVVFPGAAATSTLVICHVVYSPPDTSAEPVRCRQCRLRLRNPTIPADGSDTRTVIDQSLSFVGLQFSFLCTSPMMTLAVIGLRNYRSGQQHKAACRAAFQRCDRHENHVRPE